jgi:hypothetical protein
MDLTVRVIVARLERAARGAVLPNGLKKKSQEFCNK